MDKNNTAREILQEYTEGIWLLIENKKIGNKNIYQYTFLKDYEEKKFVYDGKLTLTTQKDVFERGELLLKLVSLNEDAIKPIVAYLAMEVHEYKETLPEINAEWEMPETAKKLLAKLKGKQNKEVQEIDIKKDMQDERKISFFIHWTECRKFIIRHIIN